MTGGQGLSGDVVEAVSGLSEVQMKAICESVQADAFADASIHVAPLVTDPLTDPFKVKNYNSLIEMAGLPYSVKYVSSNNERLDTPVDSRIDSSFNYWAPDAENTSTLTYMNMKWQQSEHSLAFPLQSVNSENGNAIMSEFHGKMETSSSAPTPSMSLSSKPRQRPKEAESHRRFILTERLRTLQELLPATLKVNQDSVQSNRESVLDNAIGYIKHLELQLKELSASQLGGEPISAPVFFLEGHGHYYQHDKLFEEPLEEVFGGLIEENPAAACKLLESKGLHMVPIDSIEALWRAG